MTATFNHSATFLVVDGVLTRPAEIVPALEWAAAQYRSLLCVCDEIETEALVVMVVNRLRGTAPGLAIKAPGTGAGRRELLEDIPLMTGAMLRGSLAAVARRGVVRVRRPDGRLRITRHRGHRRPRALVARCALQNAGALGGLVLTTDALVVDDDKGGESKD